MKHHIIAMPRGSTHDKVRGYGLRSVQAIWPAITLVEGPRSVGVGLAGSGMQRHGRYASYGGASHTAPWQWALMSWRSRHMAAAVSKS